MIARKDVINASEVFSFFTNVLNEMGRDVNEITIDRERLEKVRDIQKEVVVNLNKEYNRYEEIND